MATRRSAERIAVSVTPLPLEADSRSYRIACELAAMGFRSIVIEGHRSKERFWGHNIEVRSLAPPRPENARVRRGGRSRDGRAGRGGELALYAVFRSLDWLNHYFRPLLAFPKADLYYLHSFEFHRAVAARAGGRPVIYDAHDFYRGIEPLSSLPSFDRTRLRPFFDRLETRLVATAAAVVTVSDGVARLIERTFDRSPIVIRNCHDERLDASTGPDLRRTLALAESDRLCVVVGNRKPGMAVTPAIDAFATLPEHYHLAFLGRGFAADRAKLGDGPLARRIHFDCHVAPDQVVPAIRSADLGLVIYEDYSENYRYALPNGFFQVVAAGLPLVRGGLPEIEGVIAGRPIGARVAQLTGPCIANAITECSSDVAALRGETAKLATELRWEREAKRLQSLVDNVLTAARRDRSTASMSRVSGSVRLGARQ